MGWDRMFHPGIARFPVLREHGSDEKVRKRKRLTLTGPFSQERVSLVATALVSREFVMGTA